MTLGLSFNVGVNAVFNIIIITTIILFVLSIFYFFIDNRTITKNKRSKNLGISVLVFIVLAAIYAVVFKKYLNI